MSTSPVLTDRALGRALLARQLLLERAELTAAQATERLVGMQAQAPYAPYYGLWTRLVDFRTEELVEGLTGRTLLRIGLMRSTVHLVTPADLLALRRWIQPALDRELNTAFKKATEGLDRDAVVAAGRKLLDEQPLTTKELGERLHELWPDREARALTYVVRNLAPLVQVPPRAVWGVGGTTRYATAKAWIGAEPEDEPDVEALVLRYLATFGPASVQDVQTWAGVVRLKPVLDKLRPRLLTFRSPSGVELFDLPEAPRPDEDVPAPMRFLPEYDNLLASHADRTRVISDQDRKLVMTRNAMRPTFLVDGVVRGVWKLVQQKDSATLEVEPFRALGKKDRAAVEAEGAALLRFAAPEATPDLRFIPPGSTP